MVRLGSNRLSYRLAGLADFTSSWLWSIQLRSAYCPLLLLFLSFPFSNQYLGGGLFQKSVSLHGGLSALDWHFLYDLITPLRSWIPSVPSELYPTTHSRHEHLISLPLWSLVEPLLEPETYTYILNTRLDIVLLQRIPITELSCGTSPSLRLSRFFERYSTAHFNVDHPLGRTATFEGQYQSGLGAYTFAYARTLRRNESFL
jgi:hypothetical protein